MRSDAEALWRLTAVELGETYRSGAVDPITVTDACIERLEVVNPVLNAVVTVDRDGARNAARASSERWRRGGALGALDGVPVTVKDNLFVDGLRATWGSLLFAEHVAQQDDLPVAKLRSAGAVIWARPTRRSWRLPDIPTIACSARPAIPGIRR